MPALISMRSSASNIGPSPLEETRGSGGSVTNCRQGQFDCAGNTKHVVQL